MGLDTRNGKELNNIVNIKLLLDQMGLGIAAFFRTKRRRISPLVQEREKYEQEVRDQFMELKKKGLSIPIFTL